MKFTPIFVGLLAIGLMLPGAASADIQIDDYTAGATLSQFGAGTTLGSTNDGSILGGQRDERVTVVLPQGFGVLGFNGTMGVGQGAQDRINGGVTYDNFVTIDLTQGGMNDQFSLFFESSDSPSSSIANVVSVVASSTSGADTQFVTVPAGAGLPQNVNVSFADFAGVDFTQVNSISLNFDFVNAPGRDFNIGLFAATASVPEPGSVTLLAGLAIAGMAYRRRRR